MYISLHSDNISHESSSSNEVAQESTFDKFNEIFMNVWKQLRMLSIKLIFYHSGKFVLITLAASAVYSIDCMGAVFALIIIVSITVEALYSNNNIMWKHIWVS